MNIQISESLFLIKMLTTQSEHEPLHYIVQGEGTPVILIHGIASSLFDWKYLLPLLTQGGFRGYAPDLWGHGDSTKPDSPDEYDFDALYTHLVSWIAELNINRPFFLIGHSLGGLLSLKYALDWSNNIQGMVLINPFFQSNQLTPLLRLVQTWPELGEKALRAVPYWLIHVLTGLDLRSAAHDNTLTRTQIADDYKRASPFIVHIAGTIPDLTICLPEIFTPSLVIWGENDLTLNPDLFPELVEALPNARGYTIPRCGHQPHLGKPEILNWVVLDYLNQINGSRS